MNKLFFVLLLIFGQAMLAQKFDGFYIEPTAFTKIYTTKASNVPPPLQSEYFSIKAKKNISPNGIAIGLNFGYCFNNNDKIQLGFTQDDILQGFDIYGTSVTSFTPNLIYGQTRYSSYGGVACTNYSLLFKRNLLFFQSKAFNADRFLRVHLNMGLSFIYKPDNGLESLTGTDGITFITPDSSKVSVEATTYNLPVSPKNSFKFNVGVDLTFGKKDKEKFSFNVSFITNKSNGSEFGFTSVQTFVTDKTGITKQYSYYIKGTGNGIYFTLSKRIYPVKIYHNRMIKRLEKLKG